METLNIQRRRVVGLLGTTLVAGMSGLLPFDIAATPAMRAWPLWSLRRGDRLVYLTAETPPRRGDWRDPRIERLLPHCASIWTETNNVYRQPQAALIQRYGVDAQRPLDTWLDARDKQRLAEAATFCKTDLTELKPYRPWIVGSILQERFYQAAGWTGKSARDVLTARATRLGLPWKCEFETKDAVLAWFGGMSPLQDVQFLRNVLDEVLAGPVADDRIFEAWASHQQSPAESEVMRYSRAYPALAQRLTFARNQAWPARFESMAGSSAPPLVVVGLYHMVGPQGVLDLARQGGWKVEAAGA